MKLPKLPLLTLIIASSILLAIAIVYTVGGGTDYTVSPPAPTPSGLLMPLGP